jgi:SAM-dependent methyltransferase
MTDYLEHNERIQHQIQQVIQHAPGRFDRILDIGCGPAEHAREFQKRFGSELWLVEGHTANNHSKNDTATKSKWRDSADDFLYYHDLQTLRARLDNLGTQNYHLIDCERTHEIPADVRFDLVCSWKSCGYHYPLNTYRDLIQRHRHAGTRIVMDLRRGKGVTKIDPGWRIVHEIYNHKRKYVTAILEMV